MADNLLVHPGARLIVIAALLPLGACQLLTDVAVCRHGEACPDGEVCNAHMGVCTPPPAASPLVRIPPATGEGEGEGTPAGEGEGEGATVGEGEGEPVGGEGEGAVAIGEGEGEGTVVGGEGEGEGEGSVAPAATLCGDGHRDPGEDCDDGNRVSGDGCSATCRVDASVTEVEANDFPDDTGPLRIGAGSTTIHGGITIHFDPTLAKNVSEFDGFWLDVPNGAGMVRIQTFDENGADDCGNTQISTALYSSDILTQGSSTTFLREADFNGNGNCNVLTIAAQAPQYWVVMTEWTGLAAIPSYRMQVSTLADRGVEHEPNDTPANAEVGVGDGLDVFLRGTLSTAADVDVYAVTLPVGRAVRAEVVPTGIDTNCADFNARMAVVDAAGNELFSNGSVLGACPFVDGTGAAPHVPQLRNLGSTPQKVYVAVKNGPAAFAGALPYNVTFTVR